MITCPICQTDNDPSAVDCILCGAPLPETKPAASKPAPALTSGFSPFSASPKPEENYLTPAPVSPSQQNLKAPFQPPPSSPSPLLQGTGISLPPQDRAMSHLTTPADAQPTTRPPEQSLPASALIPAEIPPPGTLCLIIYFQRRPAFYFPVIYDEILIGRTDPASNAYPDLDVTPYDTELAISRKHCYLYRENNEYYVYPISNSGTQVNQEMIEIGTKRKLREGDVLILSGRLAIRFARIP